MKTGKKLILIASISLLLALLSQEVCFSEVKDRGLMQVDFLYSIEYTGGRSDTLKAPTDIFFDRAKRELYVVDPGNRGIFVYNESGTFVQKIRVDGKEGSPKMVAVDGDGRLYVGHLSSPKISVFSYKGEPIDVVEIPGALDLPGNQVRPLHLVNGPDGQVYALKSAGGIVKLDPFGDRHEEISISGAGAPNMMYGITLDNDGSFLFTDMRPYSVVRYSPKAKTFSRFGSAGVIYGQMARPIGIASDGSGHIFVTSLVRNNVLCYDREGKFIEEFGGIGRGYGRFYMPSKIVSDGRDMLFVLEESLKRVQVFRVKFPLEEKMAKTTGEARPVDNLRQDL